MGKKGIEKTVNTEIVKKKDTEKSAMHDLDYQHEILSDIEMENSGLLVEIPGENTEHILDITSEVAAMKTLVPDDIYKDMVRETLADDKMSRSEKNTEALRILDHKADYEKKSAEIVEDIQTKRVRNYQDVKEAQKYKGYVKSGKKLLHHLFCTKQGRNAIKSTMTLISKAMKA